MAMSYTSLTAAKGTSGALASWVSYTKLDVPVIVDEAQSLLYQTLRAREMRVSQQLTLAIGTSSMPLPTASTGQFLETLALYDVTGTLRFIPDDERYVSEQRLLQLQQFTGGVLNTGVPSYVAIFGEAYQFDVLASVQHTFNAVFYQAQALLSNSNQTNFLTTRYPHLLRCACIAAAADFMKDDEEYAKTLERLKLLIEAANTETTLNDQRGVTSALSKAPVEASLLSFISNTTVPAQAVLTEAQALIYATLRAREMRTELAFTLAIGQSEVSLPARFLEAMGRIYTTSFNLPIRHKDESFIEQNRNYTETSGTLPTGPFTTTIGSTIVSVALTNHGFSQGSAFYTTGATIMGGMTVALAGTFPIVSIVNANTFTIDIAILGSTPTSSTTDGGAACIYTCDNLVQGVPNWFGIWDGAVKFDTSAAQQMTCRMQYYQSLPVLTAPSQSNFLITRYPHLFRAACQVAEANMRRDQAAWQAASQKYELIVSAVNSENDMGWRGSEIDTITP